MSDDTSGFDTIGAVDGCVFHEWSSTTQLLPYMPAGWAELLRRDGDPGGVVNVRATPRYPDPQAKDLASYPAPTGRPGSDPELLTSQLFDSGQRGRVVLGYDEGLYTSALPDLPLAQTVVQAANRWTSEEWLSRDRRLFGMVLIASSLPTAAAQEVRRAGADDRMVAVAMGADGLDRALGHPVYHPIYEAAVEMGLPVVIQSTANSSADSLSHPVAGGLPATAAEHRALRGQSVMTHAISLVCQGVFELYPDLRVLLLGVGPVLLPGYLWRLDYWYKLRQLDVPYLTRTPSAYFSANISVGTSGLERPPSTVQLEQALLTMPDLEHQIVYASCYPDRGYEGPSELADRLPAGWTSSVLVDNAVRLFRWPNGPVEPRASTHHESV